jgi:amyloid beta precursor protein binding protein 1
LVGVKSTLQRRRYPGQSDADVEGDVALLRAELDALLAAYGVKPSDGVVISSVFALLLLTTCCAAEVAATLNDHVVEAVRYGGCEMHNIAAFMGGVVSLEIIKVARLWLVAIRC